MSVGARKFIKKVKVKEEMDETKVIISLKNISKSFDDEQVLKSIDLDIHDKEFVTLLGPSGCGKTTTLRIIGGFESPDEGDVIFMDKKVNDVPPYKRSVNTVFQKYALFPHLDVFENIAFGLRVGKVKEKEIVERVEDMLALVNLRGFERRKVATLSGGRVVGVVVRVHQRRALGRLYEDERHLEVDVSTDVLFRQRPKMSDAQPVPVDGVELLAVYVLVF